MNQSKLGFLGSAIAGGAFSLASYFLVKKFFCPKQSVKIIQSKIYEEKTLLDQYMLFNYAEPNELLLFDLKEYANVNNCFQFPKKVALLCRDHCPDLFFSEGQVRFLIEQQIQIN